MCDLSYVLGLMEYAWTACVSKRNYGLHLEVDIENARHFAQRNFAGLDFRNAYRDLVRNKDFGKSLIALQGKITEDELVACLKLFLLLPQFNVWPWLKHLSEGTAGPLPFEAFEVYLKHDTSSIKTHGYSEIFDWRYCMRYYQQRFSPLDRDYLVSPDRDFLCAGIFLRADDIAILRGELDEFFPDRENVFSVMKSRACKHSLTKVFCLFFRHGLLRNCERFTDSDLSEEALVHVIDHGLPLSYLEIDDFARLVKIYGSSQYLVGALLRRGCRFDWMREELGDEVYFSEIVEYEKWQMRNLASRVKGLLRRCLYLVAR